MKAGYWTQIGAMLIPLGVSLIVILPNLHTLAIGLIIAGFISFITGWIYTIKEDAKSQRDRKQAEEDRIKEDKWKEQQERNHHLDVLIQYEMLKRLGIPPSRVDRKYRSWLRQEELHKDLDFSLEEDEENEL